MKRLIGVLLAIACLGLFHQTLLNSAAAWSLYFYSLAKWGEPLRYATLHFDGRRLILLEPHLDEAAFSAQRLAASWAFDWHTHSWQMALRLQRPCWRMPPPLAAPRDKWAALLKNEPKWIKARYTLEIEAGRLITWREGDAPGTLDFHLTFDTHQGGSAELYLSPHDRTTHYISLSALHRSEGIALEGSCQEAHLSALLAVAPWLVGDSVPDWVAAGHLSGTWQAFLPAAPPSAGPNPFWAEGALDWRPVSLSPTSISSALSWNIQGRVHGHMGRTWNWDMLLSGSSSDKPEGTLHLSAHGGDAASRLVRLHVADLSQVASTYIQTLLSSYWPSLGYVELRQGTCHALAELELNNGKLKELRLKRLELIEPSIQLPHWQSECRFSRILGEGTIDLSQKEGWRTLTTAWRIEEGAIQFNGLSSPLNLKNIQGEIALQRGSIDRSLISFQLGSLKGKMDLEWQPPKQLLMWQLDGTGEELAEIMPTPLHKGICLGFGSDRISIVANIARKNGRLTLEGALHVRQPQPGAFDLIHFGGELKKGGPASAAPFIPQGWFYSPRLSLEKFVSPFIFRNGAAILKGAAEVKGSFEGHRVLVKYNLDQVRLENDDLRIDLPAQPNSVPGTLIGTHRFNLADGSHQGSLPVQAVSYLEKNSGLLFHDIQGVVAFNAQSVSMRPFEAYCQGVYFAGEWRLDYSDPAPGVFDWQCRCPTFSGTCSRWQSLLANLPGGSLAHLWPLEGTVSGQGGGLELEVHFIPQDYHLDAHVQGTLSDGCCSLAATDISLKEMDMEFDYCHRTRLLEFTGLQGSLVVGKPRCAQECAFSGAYLRLDLSAQPQFAWDMTLHDQGDELMRLVGHTHPGAPGVTTVHLNPALSHLSSLKPEIWECQMQADYQIASWQWQCTFDLGQLFQDLGRFRHSGLCALSPRLMETLAPVFATSGQGRLQCSYHPQTGSSYAIEAWPLIPQADAPQTHYLLINGNQRAGKWIIDPLQWDQWQAYAEWQPAGEKWNIPFLGLNLGEGILLGLQGEWYPLEERGCARLNLCEINLAKLGESGYLPFSGLSGRLKVTGELAWQGLLPSRSEGITAALRAEGQEITYNHRPISLLAPFSVLCQPDGTLRLEKVAWTLAPAQITSTYHQIEWLECRLDQNQLHFSALSQYERCPFQISGCATWPTLSPGRCALIGSDAVATHPLTLTWCSHPQGGWQMRALQGEFNGCSFALEAEEPLERSGTWQALKGEVLVDVDGLCRLCAPSTAAAIQKMGLGSPYRFSGNYWIKAPLGQPLWAALAFKGKVSGYEAVAYGYRLHRLHADLNYLPGKLEMQNLLIEDRAGTLQADHVGAAHHETTDQWSFYVPGVTVKNFRPSLLRAATSTPAPPHPKLRALTIKRADLQELKGEWEHCSTWKGRGSLHFTHSSRKQVAHPLLAIPAEIMLRLGLDPQVLNPVTGTIEFSLQDERFYLTRFKDVYSEGRGSKFYLAPGTHPSWMDLQGNLSVHVRMKQYNLIFKIAELFTVSIFGHITKPQYTLQKQPKTSPKSQAK